MSTSAAACALRRTVRQRDVSVAGVRRSPVITPDVLVGKGEEEVSSRWVLRDGQFGCVAWEAWCSHPTPMRSSTSTSTSTSASHHQCSKPHMHRHALALQMNLDLFNYLLRQRIIFLTGYVNDKVATQVVGSLLALEALDEKEDIRLYINCPGASGRGDRVPA